MDLFLTRTHGVVATMLTAPHDPVRSRMGPSPDEIGTVLLAHYGFHNYSR